VGSFGRLQALENQNERSAQLLYGSVGRLLTESGFDGRLTCYQYDIASVRLSKVATGDRVVTAAIHETPLPTLN